MDIFAILTAKPVLIGLHLGFAILGIDALLWLLGEIIADSGTVRRRVTVSLIGVTSFLGSWLAGGYYYVKFYGPLVKPTIVSGSAPWAHAVAMEAKEHIFLFILPIALTILFVSTLDGWTMKTLRLKKLAIALVSVAVLIGFALGLMGYIISAAARWAVL